jgi:flavodoxin
MKTLIIYASIHHQNTEKIAKAMAEELEADLVPVNQAQANALAAYDLIGFGSGIYGRKVHKALIEFAQALPGVAEKHAFVFSTSGGGGTQFHAALKELLVNRGFSIGGEFSCKGWTTWGPFRLFGGTNKGRPDSADVEQARTFARGLNERWARQ